jgi:hypothetical protein
MYFSNKIATFLAVGALVAMPATARRGGGGFRGRGDRDGGRRDVDNTSFKNTIDLHYHLLYILLRKSTLS